VPTAKFINALKIPAVIVPLVNADNNQHSPNENLRVGNITNGIATFISIITNNSGAIDPDK
jgi:acetylornithine deacetylase/succinyl-diaminopimelate desuccinylase-like protein